MEVCSLCKATFAQHNVSDTYTLLLLVIPILFLSAVALYDYSTVYLVNERLGLFSVFAYCQYNCYGYLHMCFCGYS